MRSLLFILFSIRSFGLLAQVGGEGVYRFLYLQPNARIAALGGNAIATPDSNDLNLVVQNPSLLNPEMHNQLAYNHVWYFADIGAGYAAYARHFEKHGTFALGIQYVNYGNFTRMSPEGENLGTFTAGDYSYNLSWAEHKGPWSYGGTLKFINSNLETYQSLGLAFDVAGMYYNPNSLISLTAAVSNVGVQLSSYRPDNNEKIPYSVQFGFSKKFAHNPLRIGLIANNLQDIGGMLYQIQNRNNKNIDLETGQPLDEDFSVVEYALSHLIVNTEVIFTKNFMFRFGYNYLRRRELSLDDARGLSGFSWGFGIKISKFQLAYGSSAYLVGRNTNHFTVVTNLSDFKRKKNKEIEKDNSSN